jgi:hypothetical protein
VQVTAGGGNTSIAMGDAGIAQTGAKIWLNS